MTSLKYTQGDKFTELLTLKLAAVAKAKFPSVILEDVKETSRKRSTPSDAQLMTSRPKERLLRALLNSAIELQSDQQLQVLKPPPPKEYIVEISEEDYLNVDLFPPHTSKANITRYVPNDSSMDSFLLF